MQLPPDAAWPSHMRLDRAGFRGASAEPGAVHTVRRRNEVKTWPRPARSRRRASTPYRGMVGALRFCGDR
jgi:hypothetical protein